MSRFLVAFRLSILTLSRSWFFLVSALPPVFILLLSGVLAVTARLNDKISMDQIRPFGYIIALALFVFLIVLAVILGVIAVKREIRDRSAKMLLCRPIGFHQWLGARFLGGIAVLTFATVANGAAFWAALTVLGFDPGFYHATTFLLTYSALVALYAYAAFLSTWMHEIPAGFLALIVNGPLFRGVAFIANAIAGGIEASRPGVSMAGLRAVFDMLYVPWPDTFFPTSLYSIINLDPARPLPITFVPDAAWAIAYAVDLTLIFYALSAAILKRRNLT